MQTAVAEIMSYIDHHDHDLAVRRILDFSHDTKDAVIIKAAIDLSREYQAGVQAGGSVSEDFETASRQVVEKLAQANLSLVSSRVLAVAENITKAYTTGMFSLKPVSVEVRTGDVLGVVGENGNGKTTLLRCIAGQLAIDGGSISYSEINKPDYYDIKSYVAFIPQRIPRWYGKLKDNLHFSASIAGIYGSENELMVEFMLERLRLTKFAELTWDQISSGYRTRFEIARVLLQKPRLLILDEPLANLDINAQQTILTDLRFMTKSINNSMGVLLSSQQLHEVEKVADNVLFIKNGACIYQAKATTAEEKKFILEIETNAERDVLLSILGSNVEVKFNGGFYTVTSAINSTQDMLRALIQSGVEIVYFRDITHSAKRFFN